MRTLAIDLGSRRVGLALSDEGGTIATPLEVLFVNSVDEAMEPVLRVIGREDVKRVVIGLPLNMDGTSGPAARAAIAWGQNLLHQANVPVLYVDERLSSFQAEQRLNHRKRSGEKITRGQKKQRLDALAAAGFLQEFLDGKLDAIHEKDLNA